MITKPSKFYIIKRIEEIIQRAPSINLLDLGSGSSENFWGLIKKYKNLNYTGIEPNKKEAKKAEQNLNGLSNFKIINDFAGQQKLKENFDLVVSFSVLEHIKYLEKFLLFSVQCLKKGGHLIHLYDLGHSLFPKGVKEKLQVFLSNHFTWLVPESKFCAYVKKNEVINILEKQGIKIFDVTYHNMPNHVALLKSLNNNQAAQIIDSLSELEVRLAKLLDENWEEFFLSVCLWGRKNNF